MKSKVCALFLVVLCVISCGSEDEEAIYVAVASNVRYAMTPLIMAFEGETGIDVDLLVNSSGTIAAQIEQGAGIDVFVSADMKYPMSLYNDGHAVEKPRLYAYGEIVIASIEGIEPTFEQMLVPEVEKIAIATPDIAPYGFKAMLALRNSGVIDSVRSKLVYGDDVSLVHQFINAGVVEMGITAKSLVFGTEQRALNAWHNIPDELYNPLHQGMLLVKHPGFNEDKARNFYEFMLSDTARSILSEYGYRLPSSK